MRRRLLNTVSLVSLLASVGCGAIWNARRSLPYNAQGRYFDPQASVVLHQQSVMIYGALAILLAIIAIGCWVIARKR